MSWFGDCLFCCFIRRVDRVMFKGKNSPKISQHAVTAAVSETRHRWWVSERRWWEAITRHAGQNGKPVLADGRPSRVYGPHQPCMGRIENQYTLMGGHQPCMGRIESQYTLMGGHQPCMAVEKCTTSTWSKKNSLARRHCISSSLTKTLAMSLPECLLVSHIREAIYKHCSHQAWPRHKRWVGQSACCRTV